MNCLKCGTKLEDGQSFCSACLENMSNYPVKPGTPVQLPPRQPALLTKQKQRRLREKKAEDEIRRLRSSVRLLTLMLVILLIAFGLVSFLLLSLLEQWDLPLPL